jgi:hypothetical protein
MQSARRTEKILTVCWRVSQNEKRVLREPCRDKGVTRTLLLIMGMDVTIEVR